MSKDKKKSDFYVDLPMVFSVVSAEQLVNSANDFYGTNIIFPKPGSRFDSKDDQGVTKEFHLYKMTMTKLSDDEKQFKNNVGGFETNMEKMGVFSNLYDLLNLVDSITIFSNLEDADIFLKAQLRQYGDKSRSTYICTSSEIQGL